ncbi:cytochrome P450 [Spinellus fusiger]|nr:cytochrome P450 [Spinellus fusiger]KAI7871300.1 cytochrome P450 [Spinellus fusiger]
MIDLLKESPLQTACVVAVGTALYALYSSSKDKETDDFDKIPTPKGKYPCLGHLPLLGKNMFLQMHKWHKELGPILHIKMGVQDFIFISDPIIAHEVFNVNGSITTSRPPNKFMDGLFTMNGRGMTFPRNKNKMRESRLAVNSFLVPKAVDQMGDMIQVETNYLIDQLIKNGNTNEGVYPFDDIAFRSLNVILRVCLGTHMDSKEDPTFKNILDIMQLIMIYGSVDENIEAYIPALSFISYIQSKDKAKRNFIDNLRNPTYKKMINQALEKDVDCIVKRMKESKDIMYDEDNILVIFTEIINGGTDSVSVTLLRAFAFLSHHPEIQRKICDEIDAFITKYKRLPMFTERENFPYIISVQREIIRLYPVTPYGLPHMAEEDFVVNNYLIKKGTNLLSNMFSMHRNPNVYPDPEKFIPERFINNTSTLHASANGKPTERDQFNFGWGRHICPGIYLPSTNGNPVYADIESFVDGGVVIMPKPYKVCFVERPDRLI